ncbi:MAG TPA: hypothetical protein PLQ97_00235 [Myxococcota bacterium]|nr:hypothetical protein [Myxococcota bacterium]HQK49601.1 hypothetical protein [Myxococcota bacterium]
MADATQELRARVFLRSALPLVKVVLAERPRYRYLLYRASGVVQFEARDSDQAAHVLLSPEGIDVKPGRHEAPDLVIAFRSLRDLNAFFAGGLALPVIRGLPGIPLLLRLLPFLLKLKILLPTAMPDDPAEKALKVRMLLQMVASGLSQLVKGGDEVLAGYAKKSPDRVFQFTVENGGPACYLRVKAGKSKAGLGTYARRRPYVHMIFRDIDGAFEVLTQRVGTVEAVKRGYLRVEGAMEGSKDIGAFMQRLDALTMG